MAPPAQPADRYGRSRAARAARVPAAQAVADRRRRRAVAVLRCWRLRRVADRARPAHRRVEPRAGRGAAARRASARRRPSARGSGRATPAHRHDRARRRGPPASRPRSPATRARVASGELRDPRAAHRLPHGSAGTPPPAARLHRRHERREATETPGRADRLPVPRGGGAGQRPLRALQDERAPGGGVVHAAPWRCRCRRRAGGRARSRRAGRPRGPGAGTRSPARSPRGDRALAGGDDHRHLAVERLTARPGTGANAGRFSTRPSARENSLLVTGSGAVTFSGPLAASLSMREQLRADDVVQVDPGEVLAPAGDRARRGRA